MLKQCGVASGAGASFRTPFYANSVGRAHRNRAASARERGLSDTTPRWELWPEFGATQRERDVRTSYIRSAPPESP